MSLDRSGSPEQAVDDGGGRRDDVLAVVEHDHQRPAAEMAEQNSECRRRRPGTLRGTVTARSESDDDGGGDGLRIAYRSELDEPRAVVIPGLEDGGGLDREAGLAGATRPDQRHQPPRPVTSMRLVKVVVGPTNVVRR